MLKDNREDILLDYAFISLIAKDISVLIVGGGRAGYIKARSFLKKGFKVSVVSKEFDDEFKNLNEEIEYILDNYKTKYILDKHLVIISTDDEKVNNTIKNDCEDHYKIYLNSSNFRDGKFLTPVERKTENIKVGIHTNVGSPKTSIYLGKKIKETIETYDGFVKYIGSLREDILDKSKNRKLNLEIMNFVNSDDFYFFYKKDKHELVLKLFWGDYFEN